MELAGSERFWALPGAGPSGHMYVLVLAAELPLGGVMALRYEPVVGPIPLLAVLIMAGVLCFWLARHISTPVSKMRTTAQQPADGTLGVRDHGPGVPEKELANIFHPFYRLGPVHERHTGGAGLGLAIAERAVRFHGGTIAAANAPGGGLLMTIRIPTVRTSSSPGEGGTTIED